MTFVVVILAMTLTPEIFATELEVIAANNNFTADFYRLNARQNNESFFCSPFWAESILAGLQSGARSSTSLELRRALRLPDDQDQIETSFRDIHERLRNRTGYALNTANRLFVDREFSIKPSFVKSARSAFDLDVEALDFIKAAEAVSLVNRWVQQKTNGKIRELVSAGEVTSRTKAILINALYFEGSWLNLFNPRNTRVGVFTNSEGDHSLAAYMSMNDQSKTFNYAENVKIGAHFLEMPLQGEDVSMVFVLPFTTMGFQQLEENIRLVLEPQEFNSEYVSMSIPKFKIESTIDVKQVMKTLGAARAFTSSSANFGGITDSRFFVNQVVQKATIKVDERGGQTADVPYSGVTLLLEPKQFDARHPFIFYIKVGELIVFIGRMKKP